MLGWLLSEVLVAVLSGVFDPPPSYLTVPWWYLTGAAALVLFALVAGAALVVRTSDRDTVSACRET